MDEYAGLSTEIALARKRKKAHTHPGCGHACNCIKPTASLCVACIFVELADQPEAWEVEIGQRQFTRGERL